MFEIKEFILNLDSEKVINLIIAIGIVAVLYILSPIFSYGIIKLFKFKNKGNQIRENAFYRPLKSFFRVLGIYIAIIYLKPILNISDNIMDTVTQIFRIIVIITTALGLAKSISIDSMFIRRIREKSERDLGDSTIKFIVKVLRVLIYIVAGFMIIADLGYDLSGLITGLGLGSVVVTIAAQDTLKNLFSGAMIILDKPFVIGDYIQFGTYEGTVEDITFRSTKLRTLENSVAQVPNSVISGTTVVNISRIKQRMYTLNLSIVLNTDLGKLLKLQQDILEFLNKNEIVVENSANVIFRDVRPNDYNLYTYCYLHVVQYDEFLKAKGKLNYEIMNIVHKNNIELAYDTKTVKIKNI